MVTTHVNPNSHHSLRHYPDGDQYDPIAMQSPDQADQTGLIHDDIGERGHLAAFGQDFSMNVRFSKPTQPRIIGSTTDFDLISVLRIQTDGLRHICPFDERHAARKRFSPTRQSPHYLSLGSHKTLGIA